MKRRSARQIEIFSMSAIDLFAAAMAAFALKVGLHTTARRAAYQTK